VGRFGFRIGWTWGLIAALASPPAWAGGWAEGLFAESGHDFGAVPRGVKARHAFVVTNRLAEAVTIVDVRASCGCTSGRASAATVAPGQSAVIEAEMDTRNFVGKKATTLTVTLLSASGRQAEVRLGVNALILSDIVLNPGTIDFGTVPRGQPAQRVLTIDRADAPRWEITRMLSACKAIDASMDEITRTAGLVSYRLTVTLKPDAPAGLIRDEIRVLTNDPESPSFSIPVTAAIQGDLIAAPSALALGRVTSAAGAQGRFLIRSRSSTPFMITTIEGQGDGLRAALDDPGPKATHLLTIAYHPDEGTTRGDLRRTLRVVTDLPGEPPLELPVTLHVDP
jgi:hypothetical protein